MAFSLRNIVSCLLKKAYKRGSRAPQDPLRATPLKENCHWISLQRRRIFGKRTPSPSSRNLKAEEGWGKIDISTKGVVDRRGEGGGKEGGRKGEGEANYRQFITLTCAP